MTWESYSDFDSSMLSSARYDESKQILELTFNTGKRYNYYDVPSDTWVGFKSANSKGSFFLFEIKDDFEYSRA